MNFLRGLSILAIPGAVLLICVVCLILLLSIEVVAKLCVVLLILYVIYYTLLIVGQALGFLPG
jgi:hypothetical protein